MMKSILPLLALVLVSACATTDSQEFHNAADMVEARDAFVAKKEACRRVGKTAFIKADASRVKGGSDEFDYKFSGCD